MIQLKAYAGFLRNHAELAAQLQVDIAGLPRRSREEQLLVAAYRAWGVQMGAHLNGQFAVALYDAEAQQLFCTRDPLGAELLFYCETTEGGLLYGTRISDLLGQPGFVRELNEEALQLYLALSYVPGEETLFRGVRKLEPGGYLCFCGMPGVGLSMVSSRQGGWPPLRLQKQRGVQLGRYFELAFRPDETKTLDEWADDISAVMDAGMRDICDEGEQLESFLSGGVDSSYMLAKSGAQKAYCVTYAMRAASEEDDARETARVLRRDFTGVEVTPEDFFSAVDEYLCAYEQPSADASGLTLFCAAKKLAANGAKVLLSGEGADEFFAGYSVYQDAGAFEGAKNPVYFGASRAMRECDIRRYMKRYRRSQRCELYMRQRGAAGQVYDAVSWMLYVDFRSYFEGSILFNSTKISQGTGLDIRMPYCDLRMLDIALRMPTRFKVGPEGNKLALRCAAVRILPDEVAYRRKLGFPVPVSEWMKDPAFNGDIRRAFASETAARFFNMQEINALWGAFAGEKTNMWHRLRYARGKSALWRRVWVIYLFIRWVELFEL